MFFRIQFVLLAKSPNDFDDQQLPRTSSEVCAAHGPCVTIVMGEEHYVHTSYDGILASVR